MRHSKQEAKSSIGLPKILEPGRNCWRVEDARRATVLVDGADYFANLEQALRKATRSIMILGWDFDGSIHLNPGMPNDHSRRLGPLLRELVESKPDLHVSILVWSVATAHAPGNTTELLFGSEWMEHARISHRLDTKHPIYGAHHEKIVCIDDRVAFVGGMDLTVERWDTSAHIPDDPRRVTPAGKSYGPVHDLQMAVEGDVARAVAEHARERWKIATGESLKPVNVDCDPWPEELAAQFSGVNIGISRTAPTWAERKGVRESEQLTKDCLRKATDLIYIEAQYLSTDLVCGILAEQLERKDGPEIVVVTTMTLPGLLERFAMGTNRDRLVRKLKRSDRYDRLRVMHPVSGRGDATTEILVHAKVMIIDDVLFRVGSANLNNRSRGLDTECDMALEASDEAVAAQIAGLRARLLAEHLGVQPGELVRAVQEKGSVIRAMEALNTRARGLEEFSQISRSGPRRVLPGTRFLDPRKPFEPLWFLRRRDRRRRKAS